MCQWMTTRLVSASVDGTIKSWEDRKSVHIVVLRPHDGHSVTSVTFMTAPHRPDHIILITGGPLNREVKIWASESEEGWLLPSDTDSWHCAQTLELKSLHMDYGPNPETTRMDYISEFIVTMPILSFTGMSDLLPNGYQIVQVYCVQTPDTAIQQYALVLSQCLPPPSIFDVYEKSSSCYASAIEGSDLSSVKLELSNPDGAPISSHPLSSPLTESESLKLTHS